MHHLRERFQFFLIIVATMMCFHFVFFAVITGVITTAVVNLVHLVVAACVVNRRGKTGKILAYYLNVCVCVCVRASTPTNFVRNIFEISPLGFLKIFYSYKTFALSRNQTKMTPSSSLAEKVATFASVTGVEDQSTSRRILKVCYS
jgi:hypothetical protein